MILAFESSCDDLGIALLSEEGVVLQNLLARQIEKHIPYGGIIPEVASREHLINLPTLFKAVVDSKKLSTIDTIAATRAPGLVGSLLVGFCFAKALAFGANKRFIAVDHLEGHIFSPFLKPYPEKPDHIPDKFVALVVSGGHTALFTINNLSIKLISTTRDDAFGEVFDKIGKKIGLAYPQGPKVDYLANLGQEKIRFTIPYMEGELDFSFSGLKSAAIRAIDKTKFIPEQRVENPQEGKFPQEILDILASFRAAAVEQILSRLERLKRSTGINYLAVSGGAAANALLRKRLTEWAVSNGIELNLVNLEYAADNAAIIGFAALLKLKGKEKSSDISAEVSSISEYVKKWKR